MVSFPLTHDEEVEEGHAVVVLRPTTKPFVFQDPQLASFYKNGYLVSPHQIYLKSEFEMKTILGKFQAQAISFRVVEFGDQYLTQDCTKIVTHSIKNRTAYERFVRLIVK